MVKILLIEPLANELKKTTTVSSLVQLTAKTSTVCGHELDLPIQTIRKEIITAARYILAYLSIYKTRM